MNTITLNPQEIISVNNNELKTTSVFVADAFKKRHDNILRRITEIASQVPENFYALNFEEVEIEQKSNLKNGTYKTRAFRMTKDGFMLLVMGFTGKLANQIKIAYIEAFNFMAEQLHNSQPKLSDLSTRQTRVPLKDAVNAMVAKTGIIYSDCYKMVHRQFGVTSVEDLTNEQIPQAVEYVHRLMVGNVIEGELILKNEVPPKTDIRGLTFLKFGAMAQDLQKEKLRKAMALMNEASLLFEDAMKLEGAVYDGYHEAMQFLDDDYSFDDRLKANKKAQDDFDNLRKSKRIF